MKKIVIKYCGGCNVAFDRVALVKEITKELTINHVDYQVVKPGEKADLGIMICGCDACCLDQETERQGLSDWVVIGPDLINYFQFPLRDIPLKVLDLIKQRINGA